MSDFPGQVFSRELLDSCIDPSIPNCPDPACRSGEVIAIQRPDRPAGMRLGMCLKCTAQWGFESARKSAREPETKTTQALKPE